MTADLSALIARLEAAEVGSRDLDGEIEELFGLWRASFKEPEKADGRHCWSDLATWSGEGVEHRAPDYTTSLDAALALAERVGCRPYMADFSIDGWSSWLLKTTTDIKVTDPETGEELSGPYFSGGRAKTPAIALCIAILRAKQGEG
ncbi:hypothetical protein [Brevundimonas olei]|uniref:hypothetical protein n=1 Tax=Brevundimonas olei TaxID=657642 RepID=UPI0031D50300